MAGGVAVSGPPRLVNAAIRIERRRSFAALVQRLRRPTPPLLLRRRVAPLSLFEYWTHHDDLLVGNGLGHAVPATLVEVVPLLLDYQLKKLPAGLRLTVVADGGRLQASVGPKCGPEVKPGGTSADLVRWLAGRRPRAEIAMAGAEEHVRRLRAFAGHI